MLFWVIFVHFLNRFLYDFKDYFNSKEVKDQKVYARGHGIFMPLG